ncbi:uncharacterized protein LOC143034437 [Oratosquilla oratoria]|uniref:uncharacterized protein LOC143034437 n=1 Tax=Oratosquilla oratoria TaxID=337810 RepID=UPI003F777B1E
MMDATPMESGAPMDIPLNGIPSATPSMATGAHLLDESSASIPQVGTRPPYQCHFCNKVFAIPARLQRHYRVHTGEKPFKCEYCEKTFSVKENLNVHRRIHTKERPYQCTICGRSFEHSGKLHRHMRTHTGERPHKCEICGKTFVQSGQLVIHMRAHTGEKPYTCDYCQKGFTCSKQLKVHTRTHTGEKPYACDICGKTFGYNHVLKMHKMSHLGEKLYKCTLCEEFFSSRKALDRHIRDHSEGDMSVTGSSSPPGSSSGSSTTCEGEETPVPYQGSSENHSWDSQDIGPAGPEPFLDGNRSCEGSTTDLGRNFSGVPYQGLPLSGGNSGSSSGSRSPGYISDDSGRGVSPFSDTVSPPRSPDASRASLTPPRIINPASTDLPPTGYAHYFSPLYTNMSGMTTHFGGAPTVTHGVPHLPPVYAPGMQEIPTSVSLSHPLYHHSQHTSQSPHSYETTIPTATHISQPTFITADTSISQPTFVNGTASTGAAGNGSNNNRIPRLAVFTTSTGERLACPAELLLRLQDHSDFELEEDSRRKREEEAAHRRDAIRRQKEENFMHSVIRVLQALMGAERITKMGYPQVSVDDIVMQTVTLVGSQPCIEPSLSSIDRVKVNLRLMLELCVPDNNMWMKFGWKGKSIEDIINEFLQHC